MYGISSAACASNKRWSHFWRVDSSAGAAAMISTSTAMALYTAVPTAPDELSTCSSAGDTFSPPGVGTVSLQDMGSRHC